MRCDLFEAFKIINGIFNYGKPFFLYFSLNWKSYCKDRFQKLNLLINFF